MKTKKQKAQKFTFESYKHCSEATQLENKTKQLEKIDLM